MKRMGVFRLLLLSSSASAICGTSMLALATAGLPENSKFRSATAGSIAAVMPPIGGLEFPICHSVFARTAVCSAWRRSRSNQGVCRRYSPRRLLQIERFYPHAPHQRSYMPTADLAPPR
jgi:hypothetical protein